MNTGTLRLLAALDTPAGEAGYRPLDPPIWACAAISDTSGGTIFAGRFHPGVSVHTRLHVRGRVYHVDHVVNQDERDVEMVLTCHEVFD